MCRPRSLVLLLATCHLTLLSSPGADRPDLHWPRWRGPSDAGNAISGSYPKDLDPGKAKWKVDLPGKGCSTPIVWGDYIFLTAPIDKKDAVLALDWQGKVRWQRPIAPWRKGKHRNGSSCNSSPTTDGERVYVFFKSGQLAALDFKGDTKWSTNLWERFGRDTLYWDYGTSPVLTRRDVIVTMMHDSGSYLAAFDKKTGDLRWKVDRNYETPVEGDHSYATPIVRREGDREVIVVWGAEHLTSHAAEDGALIWECGNFNPEKKPNWVAVSSAVIAGDVAIVPYGRGETLTGVKLGGRGNVSKANRLWSTKDSGSFVPSPAVADGKVYVLRDKGEIACVNPNTGETHWTNGLPRSPLKYYASPTIADGKLYAAREDGVVFVAQIKGKFEILSENDFGQRIIASPVPVGNRLLLRGEEQVFCF